MRILPPISLPSFPKLSQTVHLSPPTPPSSRQQWTKKVFFSYKFYKEGLLWSFILSSPRGFGSSTLVKVPPPFHVYYSLSSWWIGGRGKLITSLTSKRLWSQANLESTPCSATSVCVTLSKWGSRAWSFSICNMEAQPSPGVGVMLSGATNAAKPSRI